MNINVQRLVIARFTATYGEPNTSDPEAFMAEYSRALGGFPSPILERAIDRVIDEHEFNSWPKVGTCVKACRRLTPEPVIEFPKHMDEPLPQRTAEQKAMARKIADQFRATVGRNNFIDPEPRRSLPRVDRDAWNARFGRRT